uniref:Uncharacterized protein n=1 Tax=Chromera velia CCMP2878 TaxID=1169474 RepID=A0A0G4IE13_9ALVE|eukprot:Cvel_2366.t1-p1 / transcript=Cvel_2366.t1 / gene=Cvel_2366 / organism=Chromera_velia_CCMP2878 / gene_product=hypothetical protein / transcript_product=hypothetical protein / location=Cvel_scaffold92:18353-20683(-) / protein_length=777 / sequence_SO=supercontig / SO=protein_coding / is_pseudo=false
MSSVGPLLAAVFTREEKAIVVPGGEEEESELQSKFWWLGIILCCVNSFAWALGNNLVRYSFVIEALKPPEDRRPLYRRCCWVVGIFLIIGVTPALTIGSFTLTTASLVEALSGLNLFTTALLAYFILGEVLNWKGLLSCFVLCGGVVVVIVFGAKQTPPLPDDWRPGADFIRYAASAGGVILLLLVCSGAPCHVAGVCRRRLGGEAVQSSSSGEVGEEVNLQGGMETEGGCGEMSVCGVEGRGGQHITGSPVVGKNSKERLFLEGEKGGDGERREARGETKERISKGCVSVFQKELEGQQSGRPLSSSRRERREDSSSRLLPLRGPKEEEKEKDVRRQRKGEGEGENQRGDRTDGSSGSIGKEENQLNVEKGKLTVCSPSPADVPESASPVCISPVSRTSSSPSVSVSLNSFRSCDSRETPSDGREGGGRWFSFHSEEKGVSSPSPAASLSSSELTEEAGREEDRDPVGKGGEGEGFMTREKKEGEGPSRLCCLSADLSQETATMGGSARGRLSLSSSRPHPLSLFQVVSLGGQASASTVTGTASEGLLWGSGRNDSRGSLGDERGGSVVSSLVLFFLSGPLRVFRCLRTAACCCCRLRLGGIFRSERFLWRVSLASVAGLAGMLSANAGLLLKAALVVSEKEGSFTKSCQNWIFFVCTGATIVLAGLELVTLNKALEKFPAVFVIPIYSSATILSGAFGGICLFGEEPALPSGFWIGCGAIGLGIFGVTLTASSSVSSRLSGRTEAGGDAVGEGREAGEGALRSESTAAVGAVEVV